MAQKKKRIVIKIFALFIALFFGVIKADADCTYAEKAQLNEIASKVKANYEVVEEKVTEEYMNPETLEPALYEVTKTSFKISIYNITKDLYIVQHNNLTKKSETIFYERTQDGIYTFINDDTGNIIKYDYKIYSNLKDCPGTVLKSYSFVKPKINVYSQYGLCQGLENVPYCRKYITEELNISPPELESRINEYLNKSKKEDEENEKENGTIEFIKANYGYILAGAGVVAGTLGITIVIVKKRSAL